MRATTLCSLLLLAALAQPTAADVLNSECDLRYPWPICGYECPPGDWRDNMELRPRRTCNYGIETGPARHCQLEHFECRDQRWSKPGCLGEVVEVIAVAASDCYGTYYR